MQEVKLAETRKGIPSYSNHVVGIVLSSSPPPPVIVFTSPEFRASIVVCEKLDLVHKVCVIRKHLSVVSSVSKLSSVPTIEMGFI